MIRSFYSLMAPVLTLALSFSSVAHAHGTNSWMKVAELAGYGDLCCGKDDCGVATTVDGNNVTIATAGNGTTLTGVVDDLTSFKTSFDNQVHACINQRDETVRCIYYPGSARTLEQQFVQAAAELSRDVPDGVDASVDIFRQLVADPRFASLELEAKLAEAERGSINHGHHM